MDKELLKQLSEIIAPMAKGKTEMETAAANIKERFKSDTREYVDTEIKYNKTRGSYNGWLAQLEFNIRHGLAINSLEEKYEPIAQEIEAFVNFVNSKITIYKALGIAAILSAVPSIIDVVKKLYGLYKNAKREEKEEIIKEIEEQKWKEFKAI